MVLFISKTYMHYHYLTGLYNDSAVVGSGSIYKNEKRKEKRLKWNIEKGREEKRR